LKIQRLRAAAGDEFSSLVFFRRAPERYAADFAASEIGPAVADTNAQESSMEYEEVELMLADGDAIARVMLKQPERATLKGALRGLTATGNTGERRRRCTCGKCRTCLENARWESVFQQKFADPSYYTLREPRQGSTLSGF
jgi:hypothetical protein